LVERNFRTSQGEIDIIVEKEHDLHYIEVKTYRAFDVASMEQVIGPRKRGRLFRVGLEFLEYHPNYLHYSIQFDLIYIDKSTNELFWFEDILQHEN